MFPIVNSKFSPNQARDDHGRWTGDGGGGDTGSGGATGHDAGGLKLTPLKLRVWKGEPRPIKTNISKQDVGKLGERLIISYLQSKGMKDARHLNSKQNNFPVDLVQDHGVIEVKTGLVSNGESAMQWRATIGQPGKKETEWLKTSSPELKKAWNQYKMKAILDRKEAAVKAISKTLGKPVKSKTMAVILNPDTKTADIFEFKGFHLIIKWKSEQAKKAYVGSFKYDEKKKSSDEEVEAMDELLTEIDNYFAKYSEDQPRDEGGRFASTDGTLEARPDPNEVIGGRVRGARVYNRTDVKKAGDWHLAHASKGGSKWAYTYFNKGQLTVTDKELEAGIPDGFPHSAMEDAMKRNTNVVDKPVGGKKPPEPKPIPKPTPKPEPTPKPGPSPRPAVPKPQPRVSPRRTGIGRPEGEEIRHGWDLNTPGQFQRSTERFTYMAASPRGIVQQESGYQSSTTYVNSAGDKVSIADKDLATKGVPDDFPENALERIRERNPGALIGTPHLGDDAPEHMSYETIEAMRQEHVAGSSQRAKEIENLQTEARSITDVLRDHFGGVRTIPIDKFEELRDKRDELIGRVDRLRSTATSGFKKIPPASKPAATRFDGIYHSGLGDLERHIDTLKSVLGSKSPLSKEKILVNFGLGRAFARSTGSSHEIKIRSSQDGKNFFHEVGHILENTDVALRNDMISLRNARTEGEREQRLRDLHPGTGYSAGEKTLKDKWFDDYVGKVYDFGRHTEMVSMAMERMYTDSSALAIQDKQLYHALMRGLLRHRK